MAISLTEKLGTTAWIKDAISLTGMSVLWLFCVIRLGKDFSHMPLDRRFMYGLGAYLLLVGMYHQTPKVIARFKARSV